MPAGRRPQACGSSVSAHRQAAAKEEKLQTFGVFDRDAASSLPIFEPHFLMSVDE